MTAEMVDKTPNNGSGSWLCINLRCALSLAYKYCRGGGVYCIADNTHPVIYDPRREIMNA